MIKSVVFDFDGTLANTLPLVVFCFQEVLRTHTGREYSGDEIIAMFGPPEHEMLAQVIPSDQAEEAEVQFNALYHHHHDRLVGESVRIEQMVQALHTEGFHLGICTGKGRRTMEISSAFLPFCDKFDVIVTGDDVVQPKPNPEGILSVLNQLNVTPDEAVYVGDSNSDIVAGNAAGVTSVAVQWMPMTQSHIFEANPAYVFDNTDEFLKTILRLR